MKTAISLLVIGLCLACASVAVGQEQPDASVAAAPVADDELPPPTAHEIDSVPEALSTTEKTFRAFRSREWLPAFGALLMLIVFGVRQLGTRVFKVEWFSTKLGGFVLAFALALLAELGSALAAGQPASAGTLAAALAVAWTAGGAWQARKLRP